MMELSLKAASERRNQSQVEEATCNQTQADTPRDSARSLRSLAKQKDNVKNTDEHNKEKTKIKSDSMIRGKAKEEMDKKDILRNSKTGHVHKTRELPDATHIDSPRITRHTRSSLERSIVVKEEGNQVEESPKAKLFDTPRKTRRTRSSVDRSSEGKDKEYQFSDADNTVNDNLDQRVKSSAKGIKRRSTVTDTLDSDDQEFKAPYDLQSPSNTKRRTRSMSQSVENSSLATPAMFTTQQPHTPDTDESSSHLARSRKGKSPLKSVKTSKMPSPADHSTKEFQLLGLNMGDRRQHSPSKMTRRSRSKVKKNDRIDINKGSDDDQIGETNDANNDEFRTNKESNNDQIESIGTFNDQIGENKETRYDPICENKGTHNDQNSESKGSPNSQIGENNDSNNGQIDENKETHIDQFDETKGSHTTHTGENKESHNDQICENKDSINEQIDENKNSRDGKIDENKGSHNDETGVCKASQGVPMNADNESISSTEASVEDNDTEESCHVDKETAKEITSIGTNTVDCKCSEISQPPGLTKEGSEFINKNSDVGLEDHLIYQTPISEESDICENSKLDTFSNTEINESIDMAVRNDYNPGKLEVNKERTLSPTVIAQQQPMDKEVKSDYQAECLNLGDKQEGSLQSVSEPMARSESVNNGGSMDSYHEEGRSKDEPPVVAKASAGSSGLSEATVPTPFDKGIENPSYLNQPEADNAQLASSTISRFKESQARDDFRPDIMNSNANQPVAPRHSLLSAGQRTAPIAEAKLPKLIGSKQLIDEVVPLLWMEGYESSYVATSDKLIMQFGSVSLTTNFGNAPMQPQYVCVTMSLVAHFLLAMRTITKEMEKDLDSLLIPENFQSILGAVGYTCNHDKSGEYAAGIYNMLEVFDIIKKLTGLQSSTALITREAKKGRAAKKLKTLLEEHIKSTTNASLSQDVLVNMKKGFDHPATKLVAEGSTTSLEGTLSGSGSENNNQFRQIFQNTSDEMNPKQTLQTVSTLEPKSLNNIPHPTEVKQLSDYLQQTLLQITTPNTQWFSWDEYKQIVMLVQARLVIYNSKTEDTIETIT